MNNMFTYIDYYKDYTFNEISFNDIDALIFASLVYIPIMKLSNKKLFMLNNYIEKPIPKTMGERSLKLYDKMFNTRRYKDIDIIDITKVINDEVQFGAMTLKYGNDTFVFFEGTIPNISGWIENFRLSYDALPKTNQMAILYLKERLSKSKYVYVGGHSKGGNMALVSALYNNPDKIIKVYNFDGPGLRKEQIDSKEYQVIKNRIINFVPETSLVGMILNNDNCFVVKTGSNKVSSHNLYTWEVFGRFIETGTLSKPSIKFHNEIEMIINNNSKEDLKNIVDKLAYLLNMKNITKIDDIKQINISEITSLFKDDKSRDIVEKLLKIMER